MKRRKAALFLTVLLMAGTGGAQDWPQWRGANRDAKAVDFKVPKTWPKELTQKWKVTVGEGVATPSLMGDKLYVFSRQDGNEVTRCLNAADGKELWAEKYESLGASGPAQGFSGPRSSPAVAAGRVVTLGVRGMISCLDAANGQKLWRKDDFKAYPNFHPSSSPMIIDALVIAQLGGRDNGALVAYELASGAEKWKWTGPSPSYASPVLMNIAGMKLIIAQTESKLVAVNAADGKLAWESAAEPRGGGPGGQGGPGGPGGQGAPGGQGGPGGGRGMGGGRDYRASTPVVDGQVIITAGRGIKALKLEKEGDKIVAKDLWANADKTVSFNSPTIKNGMLYALAGNNELFCLNAGDGKLAWNAPFPGSAPAGAGSPRAAAERVSLAPFVFGQAQPAQPAQPGQPGQPAQTDRPRGPGGPGGRRGGGMGGGGGYGNIVDAGAVLMALTPGAQLIIFEPSDKQFKQVASYKVSDNQTHAYPVLSGHRIFIKDRDSVTLWTVE